MAAAAGIDRAWQDHRADVEEAIALAARFRSGFTRPADPAAEPIPSYAVSRRPPRRAAAKVPQ